MVKSAIMELDVAVIGSIALDTIRTPKAEVRDVLGGSAVYFGWAASYFSKVGIVGPVGTDFPAEHIEFLKKRSINLEGLKTEGKTFRWTGKYGKNLDQRETLSVCQEVFDSYIPNLPPKYRSSKYIFLANIDPELHMEVLSQIEKPELVAGDTMDLWIQTKKDVLLETLKKIDMMFINESEIRQLTGENNLMKAARTILSLGPETIIIKKGENGAFVLGKKFMFSIPAYPQEKVCDPTGAGDVFAGAVLGFLAKSKFTEETLRKAIVFGNVTASFCVEDFGLKGLEQITERDIMKRFENFRHLTRF